MNNLAVLERKNTVTSLELVEQINFFRKQEGNKTELGHNDLLKIIRDEFEEEISLGKISQSTYKNDRGREYPMFELTFNQARQVLVRESKFERKYHVDIKRRIDNYNKNNKPKMKNKLEYIDKIMNKLPQLYEIACKLFEGDINQIIENYKKVC